MSVYKVQSTPDNSIWRHVIFFKNSFDCIWKLTGNVSILIGFEEPPSQNLCTEKGGHFAAFLVWYVDTTCGLTLSCPDILDTKDKRKKTEQDYVLTLLKNPNIAVGLSISIVSCTKRTLGSQIAVAIYLVFCPRSACRVGRMTRSNAVSIEATRLSLCPTAKRSSPLKPFFL